MVTERGIEVISEKVQAVMEMSPPTSIKDIYVLTGRIVGLRSFISRSIKKGFPFFKILRIKAQFTWTKEAQAAFDELKKFLDNISLITKTILKSH